jgi:glycosyltransferase involved in cell wall biosynthesis
MLDVTATAVKRIPLVITYHFGSMVKGYGKGDVLIRWYERLFLPHVFRKARGIICSSVFVRRSPGMHSFNNKAIVVNPGVDTDRFKPLPKKKAGHRIMHVGGLKSGEEYKGLETSLRAMAELKPKYPDVQLAVVGNGERQPYYEKMAAQLGITTGVKFYGRLAGQELVEAYQASDVLLLPSHAESFGMVIIEAMACGVPVVASGIDGTPEVVRANETGFLVEPDDILGFAKGVSTFFDDRMLAKQFSQASRRVAVETYQWVDKVATTGNYLLDVAGLLPTQDMTERTVNAKERQEDVVTLEKAPQIGGR